MHLTDTFIQNISSLLIVSSTFTFHLCVTTWYVICVYFVHSVRKCSSVSVTPSMQCEQSLSSRESQVCLRRPVSTARLCSLSVCVCVCVCVCASAPARLYGQTVFTESVHRQCFPEFHITHGAQVACRGVFSI